MQCKSCNYARYACASNSGNIVNKGLIACSYWSHYSEYTYDEWNDEVKYRESKAEAMDKYLPTRFELYEGWADLGRRPVGTESSGMITNCCIILHETSHCGLHQEVSK